MDTTILYQMQVYLNAISKTRGFLKESEQSLLNRINDAVTKKNKLLEALRTMEDLSKAAVEAVKKDDQPGIALTKIEDFISDGYGSADYVDRLENLVEEANAYVTKNFESAIEFRKQALASVDCVFGQR